MYRLDGQRVVAVERGYMAHLGSLSVEERQSLGWFKHLKTSIGLFHAYADKERDTIYTASYILCDCGCGGVMLVSDYVMRAAIKCCVRSVAMLLAVATILLGLECVLNCMIKQ